MEVHNLTGHTITVFDTAGHKEVITNVADKVKVASRSRTVDHVWVGDIEVPILEISEHSLTEIPSATGSLFIVSGLVAAYGRREDFITPSRPVRDSAGRVIGCKAFARIRTT